jgi:hypothetical protein
MLALTARILRGVGAGVVEILDVLRRHVGDAPPSLIKLFKLRSRG